MSRRYRLYAEMFATNLECSTEEVEPYVYMCIKCIMPNPKDRYRSCNELMAALNNYLILPRRKGLSGKIFGKK